MGINVVWSVDVAHIVPVMQKAFPGHDVIMDRGMYCTWRPRDINATAALTASFWPLIVQ